MAEASERYIAGLVKRSTEARRSVAQAEKEIKRLRALLVRCKRIIESLADQQAMPDDFYRDLLDVLDAELLAGAKGEAT